MDPNAYILKSKSSNNAIAAKAYENNKRCRSNAAFQPQALKKRGVYVEKKPTDLSLYNTDTNQPTNTDQPVNQPDKRAIKPRPGRKKFLGSVLTILSKPTIGTQCPGELEKIKKQTVTSTRIISKPETSHGPGLDSPSIVKPKKFRSKVLHNIKANKYLDQDQLLVLKSGKDIIESPSNYSDTNSFRLPEASSFIRNNNKKNLLKNDLGINAERVKKLKADKKVTIDDPITLVEDTTKNKQVDEIYDFFVDLFKTTLSSQNTEGKYANQTNMPSAASSNVHLEIEETVLKKLNIKNNISETFDDITEKPSSHFCCVKDNLKSQKFQESINYRDKFLFKSSRSLERSLIRKPIKSKLKAQSFIHSNGKRSFSVTSKKKTLLNEFKEQLEMDLECFEEPRNLYQALKVMARNKRKRQKALEYSAPIRYDADADECMLKRRRIIQQTSKLHKKKLKAVEYLKPNKSSRKYIDNINSKKDNTVRTLKEESNQSLEVYGYNYDKEAKDVVFDETILNPNHSSPLVSQMNIDSLLKYTDSDLSKTLRSISQNLRSISQYETHE